MQYRCIGLDQSFSFALNFIDNMIQTKGNDIPVNCSFFDIPQMVYLYHLINSHVLDRAYSSIKILTNLAEIQINSFSNTLYILLIINIILSCIAVIIMQSIPVVYDQAFFAALTVLRDCLHLQLY
jgi:hypothetical protein